MGNDTARPPHFLNVDLDLESAAPLDALITAFDPGAFSLGGDPSRLDRTSGDGGVTYVASLELRAEAPTADACITGFCALVEGFDGAARGAWNACSLRCFNIGLASGAHGRPLVFGLPPDTLRRSLAIDATIRATLYSTGEGG